MPNSIDTPSDVLLLTLISFHWGTSSVARYCSGADPITLSDITFLAEPSIEVAMDQQQGGTQDVPVTVTMRNQPPFNTLTIQPAHAPVTCTIEEVNPADPSSRRTLFSGLIQSSTRNPTNRSGIIEAKVSGWRFPLTVATNAITALTTCNNTFGDGVCGYDIAAHRETATISAVSGAIVTLAGLTTTGTSGYWRAGYLTYDGLSIAIRAYQTGANMTLLKPPPPTWLGATVVATPGCDKLITTCRIKGREESFMGIGIGIPAYNPYIESPK